MNYILFLSVLVLLSSCASVPDKVIKQIHEEKLAGYWMTRSTRGHINFVKISCDGEIKFDYRDEMAKIFKDERDEGKIKRIHNGVITYKSWTSITRGMSYERPTQKKDGCWEFSMNNVSYTGELDDCTKPKPSLSETFRDALNSKPSRCYQ